MTRLCIPASLLLVAFANAQQAVPTAAHGVSTHDGVVSALGPDYRARFLADGVEFVPALGAAVEQPVSLRFIWQEVRRDDIAVHSRRGDVAPTAGSVSVRYQHAPDFAEVYDVRRDGIEQSFVFASRPAGHGDLVVRGVIATDLPVAAASPTGIRFAGPTGGGVAFGAVTGVDANGRRAAGSLRLDGNLLELVLPAAFVDSAALPLVLDPLIGSLVPIGDVANEPDRRPAVAYDEATNRFLVAWNVQYGSGAWEVRGQIVTGGMGSLLGAPFVISTPGVSTTIDRGGVANVRGVGRFVVVMREISAGAMVARSISPFGSMATLTPLLSSASLRVTQASAGGDSRPGGNSVTVAHLVDDLSNGYTEVRTMLVSVAANGALTTVLANNTITNFVTWPGLDISVSSHGGVLGWWLVGWTNRGNASVVRNVSSIVVGPTGTSCSPITGITTNFSGTVRDVACAVLDSGIYMIAWTNVGATTVVQNKLLAAIGNCGAMTVNTGSTLSIAAGTGFRDRPALEFCGTKWVLACRERQSAGGQARVMVLGLDRDLGTAAGAEHFPDTWQTDADPVVAAKWSAGSTADEALVVWSTDSVIRGHRFEATGAGSVIGVGGGCGYSSFLGDYNTYSGTPTLGTTFTMEIATPTHPTLALILGTSQIALSCGPCTIVPSPDVLLSGAGPFAVVVPTSPSLIGFELYTQWVQWRPSGCPLLPDLGFTNALKFTIAE
jgi:hypothetical protein